MEENEGTMRESMCVWLYLRDKAPESFWEEEAVCSRAHKSELHPPTASKPSSQGLKREEKAGMRKWLKAQTFTLYHLPKSTNSPPLCLIWEAQQTWAWNWRPITLLPVAFTRKVKRVIQKVMISWTALGMALKYVRAYVSLSSFHTESNRASTFIDFLNSFPPSFISKICKCGCDLLHFRLCAVVLLSVVPCLGL